MKKVLLILFFVNLYSQDIYINKIDINGLVTATTNQIYRNSGLHPSESFVDLNSNGIYDAKEEYTDINNNSKYDYGTLINKGSEFNNAIKNLWKLSVFADIQILVINSNEKYLDLSKTTPVDLPSGGKIWQSGVILRRISKFVTGTSEDGLIPIPIFYDPETGTILEDTIPKELREEYK